MMMLVETILFCILRKNKCLMKKTAKLLVTALALFFVLSPAIHAQSRFVDKLYYSFNVVASKVGKDIGALDVEQRIGYYVCKDFGVYLPIGIAECLYNRSTTKNYDFQGKLGLGMAYRHFFNGTDGLEVSLTGLATVGNYDFNYWQGRLMCAYAIRNSRERTSFLGLGLQYSSPYDNEFNGKKILPCAMFAWSF